MSLDERRLPLAVERASSPPVCDGGSAPRDALPRASVAPKGATTMIH